VDRRGQFDVIVIGGGPAGSVLACLLAQGGYRCLVVERDIHPRDHVGESLTPSSNPIWRRIGFLEKIENAGFVHKPGACWTAPRSPVGRFVSPRLADFPPPDAAQTYTYNVERDVFDALPICHAHESGAKVLQGATVQEVLFDHDRAVGVRVRFAEGWSQNIHAPVIVDASGRRCVLARQLRMKKPDPEFNQFGIYSWFRGVKPNPPGFEGFRFLHFLGLERIRAWQIPLRDGVCSVGVVTDKADFEASNQTREEFFGSLVKRNRTFAHNLRAAERIRPWWLEGDYSYKVERFAGKGWLLVGDAVRFVDPVFSTGIDVASYSALYAYEAVDNAFKGMPEEAALAAYERRVTDGVDAWYELITLFYKLQNLFTYFAVKPHSRERVIRILQGNLYQPETLQRARDMISIMRATHERVMDQPASLLRPGALSRAV